MHFIGFIIVNPPKFSSSPDEIPLTQTLPSGSTSDDEADSVLCAAEIGRSSAVQRSGVEIWAKENGSTMTLGRKPPAKIGQISRGTDAKISVVGHGVGNSFEQLSPIVGVKVNRDIAAELQIEWPHTDHRLGQIATFKATQRTHTVANPPGSIGLFVETPGEPLR